MRRAAVRFSLSLSLSIFSFSLSLSLSLYSSERSFDTSPETSSETSSDTSPLPLLYSLYRVIVVSFYRVRFIVLSLFEALLGALAWAALWAVLSTLGAIVGALGAVFGSLSWELWGALDYWGGTLRGALGRSWALLFVLLFLDLCKSSLRKSQANLHALRKGQANLHELRKGQASSDVARCRSLQRSRQWPLPHRGNGLFLIASAIVERSRQWPLPQRARPRRRT